MASNVFALVDSSDQRCLRLTAAKRRRGRNNALEQRFAKFSRTNRGLEPGGKAGPELAHGA